MHIRLIRTQFLLTAALALAFPALAASASNAPSNDHALLLQLAAEVASDHTQIASDHATITCLQAKLATAQPIPAASTTTYGPFTVTGKDVYLTGYNLHIQSGSGSTTGAGQRLRQPSSSAITKPLHRPSAPAPTTLSSVPPTTTPPTAASSAVTTTRSRPDTPPCSAEGTPRASGTYSTVSGGYGGGGFGAVCLHLRRLQQCRPSRVLQHSGRQRQRGGRRVLDYLRRLRHRDRFRWRVLNDHRRSGHRRYRGSR